MEIKLPKKKQSCFWKLTRSKIFCHLPGRIVEIEKKKIFFVKKKKKKKKKRRRRRRNTDTHTNKKE